MKSILLLVLLTIAFESFSREEPLLSLNTDNVGVIDLYEDECPIAKKHYLYPNQISLFGYELSLKESFYLKSLDKLQDKSVDALLEGSDNSVAYISTSSVNTKLSFNELREIFYSRQKNKLRFLSMVLVAGKNTIMKSRAEEGFIYVESEDDKYGKVSKIIGESYDGGYFIITILPSIKCEFVFEKATE